MRRLSTRAAGLLIVIGGLWGGFALFVGPYFHFTLGPTHAWTWTSGRFWLDVLPAIAAVVGGLMLISAGPGPGGRIGALIALAAGIWFAIGPDISQFWHAGGAQGAAHGSKGARIFETLTFHTGLGAVIAALAGYALPGSLLARRRAVLAEADGTAAPATAAPVAARERVPARDAPPADGAAADQETIGTAPRTTS